MFCHAQALGMLLACLCAGLATPARALNDLYWDTNGTTDGTGPVAGTWGSSNFWNSDPLGIAATFQTATSATNDVHFSAGTNGAAGTITVSGTQFANGLYFEEGAVTLSGGTISLTDGAIINNTAGTSVIPTISSALYTTGTVTLTGTRVWLNNSSFAGGGTLVVNTSNITLVNNSAALNGLATINVLSGGIDIRQNTGGATGSNYAAGTTMNFVNSGTLNTNMASSATWVGNITIASGRIASLTASNAASTFTIAGSISGAGGVNIGASGVLELSGTNTYAGTTTVNGGTLRLSGGSAIGDLSLVAMTTGTSSTNTLDVQTSETIGSLSGGSTTHSLVTIAAGQTLTVVSGTSTYSGPLSGSGAFAVAGATQTLAGTVALGQVGVSSGTLTLSGANTVGQVNVSGGTLNLTASNTINGGLAVSGGTVVLSAANTIANGVTLSGGTLRLLNAGSAGANAIQASGGTLQVGVPRGSSVTLANAITVSAGSRVALSPLANGGSSGTATVSFTGTLTVNAGGLLTLGTPGTNAAYGTDFGDVVFGAGATSGTKFQVNGVSATLTGLATNAGSPGSPAVENGAATAVTLTVALPAGVTNVYAGTLRNGGTGALALTVNGGAGSSLTLAGANTHTGSTTVTGGSLVLAHSLALQNTTVTTGGTGLVFDASVASHTFRIGGLGASTDLALQDNGGNAVTLILGGGNTAQTYNAVFSGSGGLTKTGTALLTLGGTNTYTGATTVNSGELRLEFSTAGAPLTNIINPSSTLVLGGGQLGQRQGSVPGPVNGQTFNGTTVKAGSSIVNQVRSPGGTMLLTLGAITRETGGTAAFSANGSGSSGIAATGTNTASGIIGGWATYLTINGGATNTNTTDWAIYSGGKIVALAAGSYTNTAATTAATNLDLTASVTLNANVTLGSVRFNNAIATPTLTLNGAHTVGSGGILVTGNVGANATRITGGSITSGNGQDLVIIQNNTNAAGALTIDAEITGNVGLTKSGGGQLILTGTNTYTGDTYLNGGVTSISSNANLGSVAAGGALHLNGGTLSTTASVSLDNAGANVRGIVLETNGGTLDVASGQTLTVRGAVSGEGALNITGGGTVLIAGTASTHTGATTVTAGNLQAGAAGVGQTGPGAVALNGAGAVLSGSGSLQGPVTVTSGVIRAGDTGGSAVGTLTTGDLIFTPATSTTVAEFQLTGSTSAGTLASDRLNINGSLTLNGNSNILVDGTGYTPTLGDSFVLLDWTTVLDPGTTSTFSTGTSYRTGANIGNEGNLDLPDLSSYGLGWDILNFSGSGSLTIVVVPEPGRMLLALIGLAALGCRRRRIVR